MSYKDSELRLVRVIQEARDMVGELEQTKRDIQKMRDDLPKSLKAERLEIERVLKEVANKQKELRAELHAAHQAARNIEGRKAWKEAVRANFGEEGLKACYAYMDTARAAGEIGKGSPT